MAPASESTLLFNKWKAEKGKANMWISIFDMDGHTFPAYNRGLKNTLSDGLKYVMDNGYIANPTCNLYEWILMQEIGKPAIAPPTLKVIPPVPGPTTPKPETPKPDSVVTLPKPPPTIKGFTHSSDGKINHSVTLQVFWSDGTNTM